MLVRYNNDNATHGYEMIDLRETMPEAAGDNTTASNQFHICEPANASRQLCSSYGVNQTKSLFGGLSVGVPGELRGQLL